MPLIKDRIKVLMSDTIRRDEFSHTILHKQKLLMTDLKFNDIKQIVSNKPTPKDLLEKETQEREKEKEKPKQLEKISRPIKMINSPREVSPRNAQLGNEAILKQQDIESRFDFNAAVRKRKEQFKIEFQPLNFDLLKRKEIQDNSRKLGFPNVNLPKIKSRPSVSPPNQDSKTDRRTPPIINVGKEPRIYQLPKSNIGAMLINSRPKSPVNGPSQKSALSKLKSVLEQPPEIKKEVSSCCSNRSEIIRFERPEVRVDKSPRSNLVGVKQITKQSKDKRDESWSGGSACKENISINSNISFRRESTSPQSRGVNISEQQQKKMHLVRMESLAKVIESKLKKNTNQEENGLKEAKVSALNISFDQRRSKDVLTIQIEDSGRADRSMEQMKIIITPGSRRDDLEIKWPVSDTLKDSLEKELTKIEAQTPTLGKIDETEFQAQDLGKADENKSTREESLTSDKKQSLPELTLGMQKITSEIPRSKAQEESETEKAVSNTVINKDQQICSNIHEAKKGDVIRDKGEVKTGRRFHLDQDPELDFQKQRFKPILEERLDPETMAKVAQICKSKLNELTRSIKEIDVNPFGIFENEINGIIQGKEDLAYCIPLLIIEGLLN